MVILTIPAFCFQSEYYLYISTGYSGNLPVLKVLPSGEIINTGYLYATGQHPTMGLISTQNLLIVSSAIPSNGEFVTYKFNPDFTLTILSITTSTTSVFYINLTPNGKLILKSTPYYNEIWSVDSLGIVSNTGNTFLGYFINPVRSQGDISISANIGTGYMPVYQIDYVTMTLSSTQNIPFSNVNKIIFAPDGKLAIGIGSNLNNTFGGDVGLFTIDSSGSVSTTTTILYLGRDLRDATFTPDGRFVFLVPEGGPPAPIITLQVNSNTTSLQDTGKRFQHPNANQIGWSLGGHVVQTTPDGRMLIYFYISSIDDKFYLATAWINGDGSLAWTGYDFPYESYFSDSLDYIQDMVIVPNYITSIPDELWQGFEKSP